MNTVEIGNELENLVYEWLKERLDIYGKYVRLNRHKAYACANGRKIVLDISIDVYASQEFMTDNKPANIYIFECKNLKHVLDISDFDEWRGKLEDLGNTGHKLYIVSRKGFSRKTIKLAEDRHVGLIRVSNNSEPNYVLTRTVVCYNNQSHSMSCLLGEIDNEDNVCYSDYVFSSLEDMLIKQNLPIKNEYRVLAPQYSNDYIEEVSKNIICEYGDCTDVLGAMLEDKAYPSVSHKAMSYDRLGYIDLLSGNICISSSLTPTDLRYRFVLAHEYGHFILHRKVLGNKISVLCDNDVTLKNPYIGNLELKELERQANRFATYLLMPTSAFVSEVFKVFRRYDIRGGFMYVDSQPCNISNYHQVTSQLSVTFRVSKLAAAYRMMELKLLQVTEGSRILIGM